MLIDGKRDTLVELLSEFRVVGSRESPPDPAILKAIGLNHGLESAMADLVDNSIDAAATRILIRFVLSDGVIRRLLVVDNGNGMTSDEIDTAMQLGSQRTRSAAALGHFGLGLKAASFSQASTLTVLSRARHGVAVGRRMHREPQADGFMVDELESAQVRAPLDDAWNDFTTESGTIVLWDDIRTFPKSKNPAVTNSFVEAKVNQLRHHLGLTFHRLLEQDKVRIEIDVLDADSGETGFPFEVEPINPFAYVRSGAPGYPKTLIAAAAAHKVPLVCHVWPAKSDSHRFKLAGMPIDATQGFYMYRNDRLLSGAGWAGVTQQTKRRRLARVAVDIEYYENAFLMSAEKADVHMTADLVHAIETAIADDGTTWGDYLQDAEQAFKASNRKVIRRTPVLPPGQGIGPKTKRAINRELEILEGEEPVRIRWRNSRHNDFVDVDRPNRTLWLNSKYRDAILHGESGSMNDAPLLKALLFLLYEDIFRGTMFGPKDKDNVDLWREVLTAAALEEHNADDE